MICLNPLDYDTTRFIWVIDPKKSLTPDNLIYFRFSRVLLGANASPYLFNMVLKDLISKPPIIPNLIQTLRKFYIDNFVHSVNTPAEAIAMYKALSNRLKIAKFNL